MSSTTRKNKSENENRKSVSRRRFLESAATVGGAGFVAAGAETAASQDAKGNKRDGQSNQEASTAQTAAVKLAGEMTEYKSGDLVIPAYISRPSKRSLAPAVLVIHEVFGLNDHIKTIADRLARAGYTALAPNFFARASEAPPRDASDIEALRRAARSIPPEAAIRDMQAGLDYLKTVRGVRKRFASIGFCMGGGFSYQLATHTKDLAGAAIFYGRTPLELVPQVSCPLLGVFGELDSGIPPASVQKFEEALKAAGKTAEIKVYPKAKHGFFNDTRPTAYDAEAATDAYARTLKFFRKHLGS